MSIVEISLSLCCVQLNNVRLKTIIIYNNLMNVSFQKFSDQSQKIVIEHINVVNALKKVIEYKKLVIV